MLFDHLAEEVDRISLQPGRPLSQASTAAKWLYRRLVEFYKGESKAVKHLEMLFRKQPAMVIERVSKVAKSRKPRTSRVLISEIELEKAPEFWTVESRLVDSLGLISRDLGRELSLNEFIGVFAPDEQELSYSPIVPDAHQFRLSFALSHAPAHAQFCRKHQRSAIKWVPRDKGSVSSLFLNAFGSFEFNKELEDVMTKNRYLMHTAIVGLRSIDVADLVGDDADVLAVKSRSGFVVKSQTIEAVVIHTIKRALVMLMSMRRYH